MQKRLPIRGAARHRGDHGCNDGFLTEVPTDFVGPTNFYNNQDDALAA
jgi:hypothetical protein